MAFDGVKFKDTNLKVGGVTGVYDVLLAVVLHVATAWSASK